MGTAKGSAPVFVDYLDRGLTTEDIVSVMAELTKEVFLEKHGRRMTSEDERILFQDLREWIN